MNLHYSKADYEALTPKERMFIRKAFEDATVFRSTIIRDAVLNAEYNVNRKKSKPFRKLWTRIQNLTKSEKAKKQNDLRIIKEIEEKETGWVRRLYEVNGYIKKKSEGAKGEKNN